MMAHYSLALTGAGCPCALSLLSCLRLSALSQAAAELERERELRVAMEEKLSKLQSKLLGGGGRRLTASVGAPGSGAGGGAGGAGAGAGTWQYTLGDSESESDSPPALPQRA